MLDVVRNETEIIEELNDIINALKTSREDIKRGTNNNNYFKSELREIIDDLEFVASELETRED